MRAAELADEYTLVAEASDIGRRAQTRRDSGRTRGVLSCLSAAMAVEVEPSLHMRSRERLSREKSQQFPPRPAA